jgi:hypothetical protein
MIGKVFAPGSAGSLDPPYRSVEGRPIAVARSIAFVIPVMEASRHEWDGVPAPLGLNARKGSLSAKSRRRGRQSRASGS